VTDDRQTDHATEKCVAMGGIACARAIPPNNTATLMSCRSVMTTLVSILVGNKTKLVNIERIKLLTKNSAPKCVHVCLNLERVYVTVHET